MGRENRNQNARESKKEFTNVERLKIDFWSNAENRRKAGDKAYGDAGYWNNGRCNWGGSHSLDEDCEELAKFFNGVDRVTEDINEIRLSANETIFNQRKQVLTNKIKDLCSKCRITSSTSIAGICCIWDDYFGSYLKPYLNTFSSKLTRQLDSVIKLEPKHQKELLELESQARSAENAYKENLQKANDETDPNKQAEYIALANQAKKKADEIKKKVNRNPIVEASQFNFLDDLRTLVKGNVPPNVTPDRQPRGGNNPNANLSSNPTNFFEQNKTLIFLGLGGLALFYLYSQNNKPQRNYY